MQWKNLLGRLVNRGKVDTAAIIDHEGNVLASTSDWKMSSAEFSGMLRAASSNSNNMVRIKFAGHLFTCLRYNNSDTIVGKAESKLLVARLSNKCLVVGLADPVAPGSVLYEVTEFGEHLMRKGY